MKTKDNDDIADKFFNTMIELDLDYPEMLNVIAIGELISNHITECLIIIVFIIAIAIIRNNK